ncbi:hypothetical protein [Domibacillus tundrae]|uniref:hypothetical protein n=1 Tax=Domibacillus tundrae TaxID=1587527 RepID=UPI0033972ACC
MYKKNNETFGLIEWKQDLYTDNQAAIGENIPLVSFEGEDGRYLGASLENAPEVQSAVIYDENNTEINSIDILDDRILMYTVDERVNAGKIVFENAKGVPVEEISF